VCIITLNDDKALSNYARPILKAKIANAD